MHQLKDWLLGLFSTPPVEDIASREYEEARRNLLQHQSMCEYHENMVRFESQRIERLGKMLNIDQE